MTQTLDEPVRALLNGTNPCYVTTLRKDGSPHLVATWVHSEGDEVLLNSVVGRAWPSNLERDPRVAILVQNAENSSEYVQIRGRCIELTEAGAEAHIDALTKKYTGLDSYPYRKPGERRVTARIRPEHVYRRIPFPTA